MWPRLTEADLELAAVFNAERSQQLRKQSGYAGFVYFDLGNVLIDLDWDSYFQATHQLVGTSSRFSMESFTKAMLSSGLARQWSIGEIGNAHFAAGLKKLLVECFDIPVEQANNIFPQQLKQISSLIVGPPRRRVFDLVKALRQRGFMIGLCSNSNPWHEIDNERNRTLYDLFDTVVYSHDVSCEKPEPAIYDVSTKMAISAARAKGRALTKQDIYFVDDLPANVRAARESGWNASLVCLVRSEILEAFRAKNLTMSEFEKISCQASSLVFGDAAARRVERLFTELIS